MKETLSLGDSLNLKAVGLGDLIKALEYAENNTDLDMSRKLDEVLNKAIKVNVEEDIAKYVEECQ